MLEEFFAELNTVRPGGLRYSAYQLDYQVSFVHLVDSATRAAPFASLPSLPRLPRLGHRTLRASTLDERTPPGRRLRSSVQPLIIRSRHVGDPVKEFRQLTPTGRAHDPGPSLLLVLLGYAAPFDMSSVRTKVFGLHPEQAAGRLPTLLHVVSGRPGRDRSDALPGRRDGSGVARRVGSAFAGAKRLHV
jgi:hypothetical protein